jgi:peptidoglycan hydrolase-like protein with peptidoglycan-binding domain
VPIRPVVAVLALLVVSGPAILASAAVADPASAAAVGGRALRAGVSGQDVRDLEQLLDAAGFDLSVDGTYDSETTKAVKAFQAVVGLTSSGTAGRKTVTRLRAATRPAAARTNNGGATFGADSDDPRSRSLGDRLPVRRGMSGRDVKMLQDFLKRDGVGIARVDGEFGGATARAVRAWERKADREVDGVVDAGDVHALRTAVGAVATAGDAGAPLRLAPGQRAKVGTDGLAIAPADAPEEVKQIIASGNEIAKKPYRYGGGHGRWKDSGYDCSGSVSYALHGVPSLLDAPLPSSGFFGWGESGEGQWVTIYTKASHMYMVIAGLRFDTSGRTRKGTRWQADLRDPSGFKVRHPKGL